MLQHGEDTWSIELYKERNLPIPDWVKNKVEVPRELVWYWQAFWQLDTCRFWTEGQPRAIPWTAIKQYSDHHDLEFDCFHNAMSSLDTVYLKHAAAQQKKQNDEMKRQSKRGVGKKPKKGR